MNLDVPLSLVPMGAEPVGELPPAGEWLYEPKIDGFRCIVFRDGAEVQLQSHRQKSLNRYFPEIATSALRLPRPHFVLDGELVILGRPFDELQLRIYPSASRVKRLSVNHPAQFVAFDLLADSDGKSMLRNPFSERRKALEQFFREITPKSQYFLLCNATRSPAVARTWLKHLGSGLDGIVIKNLDTPYRPGKRAMQKFKIWKTVDCVLGGLYFRSNGSTVEHLLMGLYDQEGKLHYVGHCDLGGMSGVEAAKILQPLVVGGPSFTGRAPATKNRWSGRDREYIPLQPKLVAEISADHIENGRFRHGSRLLRWRTDKSPEACTMDQIMGTGLSKT